MYEKSYCGVQQKGVLLVVVQLDRSLVTKFCRCYVDFVLAYRTSARVKILLLDDDNYMKLTTELYWCTSLEKSTTSWRFFA